MVFSIENEFVSVKVKQFGAELNSFKSKETDTEYLWQGNPDVWYGQSPILFPIVGTLLNNKYRVDGKEYEMFRHGIARKRDFELKEQGEDYLILTQKWNEDTLKAYPYKYIYDIEFRLDGKKLSVTSTIMSDNGEKIYFSIGGHPGFNCKMGDILEFEQEETELVNEMIDEDSILFDEKFPVPVEGKIFTVTEHIFDKDAHVLSGFKSKKCTLKGENRTGDIEFVFGDAPYLGLWAKPGADYVCIEPWYGINDSREEKADFSQKRAIESVEKDGKFVFNWSAEIKDEH